MWKMCGEPSRMGARRSRNGPYTSEATKALCASRDSHSYSQVSRSQFPVSHFLSKSCGTTRTKCLSIAPRPVERPRTPPWHRNTTLDPPSSQSPLTPQTRSHQNPIFAPAQHVKPELTNRHLRHRQILNLHPPTQRLEALLPRNRPQRIIPDALPLARLQVRTLPNRQASHLGNRSGHFSIRQSILPSEQ